MREPICFGAPCQACKRQQLSEVRREFDEWCNSPLDMPQYQDDSGLRCANPRKATLQVWLEYNHPEMVPCLDEIWNIPPTQGETHA